MTQVSSNNASNTKKHSFFTYAMLHNGIQNVKGNLRIMIVILVLHMIAVPLYLTTLMITISTLGYDDADAYLVIGILATGVAFMAGMIVAYNVFSYLYKKTGVDMKLSLPMSTAQRFVSDFLSGLFIYIVPFLASQLVSGILLIIGYAAFEGKTFYSYYDYPHSWICDSFSVFADCWWKLVVAGLVMMLMFYTLTVLVSSCCGNLFECVAYNLILNTLLPLCVLLVIFSVTENVMGFEENYFIFNTIPYSSPVGGLLALYVGIGEEGGKAGESLVPIAFTFGKWLVIYFLEAIALAVGTYFVYRKRKAEDTGKPVVFSIFYHFLMSLILVVISYAFLMGGDEMIIPMIIVTAVVYMIFTVIRNRGFHRFFRSIGSYILTMIASIGVFAVIVITEGFGAGIYVPAPSAVKEAYISYNGYFNSAENYNFGTTFMNRAVTTLKDTEDIRIVVEAHKMVLDPGPDDFSNGDSFRIMYVMKNGKIVIREYTMNDKVRNKLSELDMRDAVRERIAYLAAIKDVDIRHKIENEIPEYYKNMSDDAYRKFTPDDFVLEIASKWSVLCTSVKNYDVIDQSSLPEDFIYEFTERLYNDVLNETAEEYFTPSGRSWRVSYFDTYNCLNLTFTVKESYTSTIEYLRACGAKLYGLNTAESSQLVRDTYFSLLSHDIREKLVGKELVCSTPLGNSGIRMFHNENTWSWMDIERYSKINDESDELFELMEAAQTMYKTDENCYTIYVDGDLAVIPYEYSEKAERLYIMAVAENFSEDSGGYIYDYMLGINEGTGRHSDAMNYAAFINAFIECYGEARITQVLNAEGFEYDANELISAMKDYSAALMS